MKTCGGCMKEIDGDHLCVDGKFIKLDDLRDPGYMIGRTNTCYPKAKWPQRDDQRRFYL